MAEYEVIRVIYGGELTPVDIQIISEFAHQDISTNSFLRAWTSVSWADYHANIKPGIEREVLPAAFDEHVEFKYFNNVHAPMTLVVVVDGVISIIRYFVTNKGSIK